MCWTQKLFLFQKNKKTLEKRCVSPCFFSSAPKNLYTKTTESQKKKWDTFYIVFFQLAIKFSTAEWFFFWGPVGPVAVVDSNVHQQTPFFCASEWLTSPQRWPWAVDFFLLDWDWGSDQSKNSEKLEGFFFAGKKKKKTLSKPHVGWVFFFSEKFSELYFFFG